MQVAVITDSIACLTPEQVSHYGIGVVPLYIRSGSKTYRDGVDITATGAYELFLKDPDDFSTSASTPEDFIEAFRTGSRASDEMVCITLSAKLSTTYNAAVLAAGEVRRENPQLKINVIDSQTATAAEGMVVLEAARAAAGGATFEALMQKIQVMKEQVNALVLLDTIKHVYRSGRVPRIAAQAGSVLNIHPLFTLKDKVNLCGVVRNFDRGIERMITKIKSEVGNKPIAAAVMHAYAPAAADSLYDRVKQELNCGEMWKTEFSPLMGYACGTGTVGVAYFPLDQAPLLSQ